MEPATSTATRPSGGSGTVWRLAYEGRLPVDYELLDQTVGSADVDGRRTREPYVHGLAGQVGLTVIGPGQL